MFSGIVEKLAEVKNIVAEGTNIHFTLSCDFIQEVYIDQSIAHNGVCLTVVNIDLNNQQYTLTAIEETLTKTNLKFWKIGTVVNIERSLKMGDRLDGHLVQGHVDTTGKCILVEEKEGSWNYTFEHPENPNFLTVEKGSICINGVSLTVVNSQKNQFSVSIIPYTYQHTNFKYIQVNDIINLEFDILGKYFAKYMHYGK
jgi:riboflavin synthase